MAYAKFLIFQLTLIAMLYMGLTGTEGAFNVYGAMIGIFVFLYIFLWVDDVRDAVVEKIRTKQQRSAVVPMWLRYTVMGGQGLVLVWFGHFVLALCMAFILFTTLGRIDSVIQPTPTE